MPSFCSCNCPAADGGGRQAGRVWDYDQAIRGDPPRGAHVRGLHLRLEPHQLHAARFRVSAPAFQGFRGLGYQVPALENAVFIPWRRWRVKKSSRGAILSLTHSGRLHVCSAPLPVLLLWQPSAPGLDLSHTILPKGLFPSNRNFGRLALCRSQIRYFAIHIVTPFNPTSEHFTTTFPVVLGTRPPASGTYPRGRLATQPLRRPRPSPSS
jgi:hypothetical protein